MDNLIRIFIWSQVNVRLNFRLYIQNEILYTYQNENFEYSYPLGRKLIVYHSHVWPLSVAPKYTYGQAHKILVVLRHMHAMKILSSLHPQSVTSAYKFSSPTRCLAIYGPQCKKTCLRRFANNKGADQPAHLHRLISTFVI